MATVEHWLEIARRAQALLPENSSLCLVVQPVIGETKDLESAHLYPDSKRSK